MVLVKTKALIARLRKQCFVIYVSLDFKSRNVPLKEINWRDELGELQKREKLK